MSFKRGEKRTEQEKEWLARLRREYGPIHTISQYTDEGYDPQYTVQDGSDRTRFNLGDGCRWRQWRKL